MADTKAVSVRLPLDLLNELNSYATDKGMVRSGDANIGGAIIAILREYFGGSDNVVKQVSDNVDIDSKINDAIAPLIARLEALENTRSEAIASEKKAPDTIQKSKGDSNAEITENSIEPDSLPIIEAIANIAAPTVENPDSSNALRDAIAATAKTKSTKRQSKKSEADRRFTADEAAKYYSEKSGKALSASSLRTNAKKYGFMIKEKGSGLYALIDS